jgi:hypothetical protein
MASRSTTTLVLAIASMVLFLAGFVFLAFYVTSAAGPHLRYLGAGFLAACAAFMVGCLVGLIVGIPRFVSSGAMRHAIEAKVARTATPGPAKVRVTATAPAPPAAQSASAPAAPGQGQAAPAVAQPAQAQPAAAAQSQSAQGAQAPMAPMGPMTPMTLVASGGQQESVRTTAPDGFPAITDQDAAAQATSAQASSAQAVAAQAAVSQTAADQSSADPGSTSAAQASVAPGAAAQDDGTEVSQLTPSTNLAEISDWLTKLLLGAGLVELTRLGHPLSSLIDAVARGLQGIPAGGAVSGSPVLVAASILVMYVVLGFLDGYVVTTLWYGKYLQRLGYG